MRVMGLTLIVLGSALLAPQVARAEALPPASDSGEVCTVGYQMYRPADCPANGPGSRAVHYWEMGLLPARPLPAAAPDPALAAPDFGFARVSKDNELRLYPSVADAASDNRAVVKFPGFVFISYQDVVERDGERFYITGGSEVVRRDDAAPISVHRFQGLLFNATPARPFGWVVESTSPRSAPGSKGVELRTWLPRYTVIQAYDTRQVDGLNWYMIGVDQWVDQRKVGLVEPSAVPPPDVPIGTRWITINLFEQTLAAYDNGRLVFATLVAGGIPPWHTRPGTFQVFKKVDRQPMSGSFAADRSDYYYLQDVPWVLYFDRARALHGTYWHDGFGYKRSHGCVNMSIGDASWIYEWADLGTWVYVYDPSGQTPTDAATYANDAGGP
jgi:hypothetical protein